MSQFLGLLALALSLAISPAFSRESGFAHCERFLLANAPHHLLELAARANSKHIAGIKPTEQEHQARQIVRDYLVNRIQQYVEEWNSQVPGMERPYRILPMAQSSNPNENYLFNEAWRYLNLRAFTPHEKLVHVGEDGRLYYPDGTKVSTKAGLFRLPSQVLHIGNYVMDGFGNFYISTIGTVPSSDRSYHSDLSFGLPVAGAGEISVIDGRVVILPNGGGPHINRESGHYLPLELHLEQVLSEARLQGLID